MLRNDVGQILGVRVAAGPIIKQHAAVMANTELGGVFIQLHNQARVFARAAHSGLRTTERDQRWLDRLDMQADRIGNRHEFVERSLVRDG